jgi:hypothetical protein
VKRKHLSRAPYRQDAYTLLADIAKLSSFGLCIDLVQNAHSQDQQMTNVMGKSIILVSELFGAPRDGRSFGIKW